VREEYGTLPRAALIALAERGFVLDQGDVDRNRFYGAIDPRQRPGLALGY
jgi:hypothetical protein